MELLLQFGLANAAAAGCLRLWSQQSLGSGEIPSSLARALGDRPSEAGCPAHAPNPLPHTRVVRSTAGCNSAADVARDRETRAIGCEPEPSAPNSIRASRPTAVPDGDLIGALHDPPAPANRAARSRCPGDRIPNASDPTAIVREVPAAFRCVGRRLDRGNGPVSRNHRGACAAFLPCAATIPMPSRGLAAGRDRRYRQNRSGCGGLRD